VSTQITVTPERVDDIPAIMTHLTQMRVAELLDNHFPPNGNWQGLSLGRTTVVWLAFILSEGDHRLYRVEPWVTAHQRTLSRCLSHEVKPRDLTDGARLNVHSTSPCCVSMTCRAAWCASTPRRLRPM